VKINITGSAGGRRKRTYPQAPRRRPTRPSRPTRQRRPSLDDHRPIPGRYAPPQQIHRSQAFLARGAVDLGTGINHLVVQVESLDTTLADLAAQGIVAEPPGLPAGTEGPRTSWITDPDGYRIELVQWPVGHADGITEADFA
jgi:catechol 2,3-dioxygenase-like lactoylglutathione lyase family enzyme